MVGNTAMNTTFVNMAPAGKSKEYVPASNIVAIQTNSTDPNSYRVTAKIEQHDKDGNYKGTKYDVCNVDKNVIDKLNLIG